MSFVFGSYEGYGREFRERLLGSWGIVDVNDCCNCAKFLVNKILSLLLYSFNAAINFVSTGKLVCFIQVDSGRVDGERLCITGSSAGGYTTLAALAFRDVFKAGASLYGVSKL